MAENKTKNGSVESENIWLEFFIGKSHFEKDGMQTI